jgi:flagellar P-ring protein precursor FlgI
MLTFWFRAATLSLLLVSTTAMAAQRLKEISTLQGMRDNQLVGYGIVVGLDGSGDQTTQTPFTVQSVISMLTQLGVQLPPGTGLQLKNVAAVSLTGSLPPFAKSGQKIDLTVSSIGNAKSLRGGTLLMSPLKGADGQIYAIAQGNVLVGGAGAAAAGASAVINHLSVGRIPGGATVEREVPTSLGQGEFLNLELKESDFSLANRVVQSINLSMGAPLARAIDARQVQVRAPLDSDQRVRFIASLENISVTGTEVLPRVIINARTGSVVMNQSVEIQPCAVAHGNLSVVVNAKNEVSQPNPLSGGQTKPVQNADIKINAEPGSLIRVPKSTNLGEVVKALNAIGATPQDLLSILQAMKAAGALSAELEII